MPFWTSSAVAAKLLMAVRPAAASVMLIALTPPRSCAASSSRLAPLPDNGGTISAVMTNSLLAMLSCNLVDMSCGP